MSACSVVDCPRRHHGRGYCMTHLRRLNRGATVDAPVVTRAPAPLLERLWRRTVEDAAGCWRWTGSLTPNGYGQIHDDERVLRLVHRVGYELLVGPVPDGLDLDHLCRVRPCWRPEHLEPVTRSENLLRGYAARRGEAIACHS